MSLGASVQMCFIVAHLTYCPCKEGVHYIACEKGQCRRLGTSGCLSALPRVREETFHERTLPTSSKKQCQ